MFCSDIVKLELEMKGIEPRKANVKFCDFRKMLLEFCKASFELFFQVETEEKKKELESKTDDERTEIQFKKKHRLFGNIDFVGELYKRFIISEGILKSVFSQLLGMNKDTTG